MNAVSLLLCDLLKQQTAHVTIFSALPKHKFLHREFRSQAIKMPVSYS